jgi:hypothetical protein
MQNAYRVPSFLAAETARFAAAALSVEHLVDSLTSPMAGTDELLTYSRGTFDAWVGPDAHEAAEAPPAHWDAL